MSKNCTANTLRILISSSNNSQLVTTTLNRTVNSSHDFGVWPVDWQPYKPTITLNKNTTPEMSWICTTTILNYLLFRLISVNIHNPGLHKNNFISVSVSTFHFQKSQSKIFSPKKHVRTRKIWLMLVKMPCCCGRRAACGRIISG